MAAKRYRDTEHRTFHRAASYTEGRSDEALPRRARAQAQEHLRPARRRRRVGRLRVGRAQAAAGRSALPVPYPVQIDGTEILMEWITVRRRDRAAAGADPARPGRCWRRTSTSCATPWPRWCRTGSCTATCRRTTSWPRATRLVIIDLPQIVDLVGNPNGMDFLLRDCANICGWFRARGLEVDEHELFGELMAHAF